MNAYSTEQAFMSCWKRAVADRFLTVAASMRGPLRVNYNPSPGRPPLRIADQREAPQRPRIFLF